MLWRGEGLRSLPTLYILTFSSEAKYCNNIMNIIFVYLNCALSYPRSEFKTFLLLGGSDNPKKIMSPTNIGSIFIPDHEFQLYLGQIRLLARGTGLFWFWSPIENSIFEFFFKIIVESFLIARSIGNFILKNQKLNILHKTDLWEDMTSYHYMTS